MLQVRGVIGHSIPVAWEVEGVVVVAMLTLVEAAQIAQHGRNSIRSECSFVHSRDRGGVVASSEDGAVSEVGALGEQADLGELAGALSTMRPRLKAKWPAMADRLRAQGFEVT